MNLTDACIRKPVAAWMIMLAVLLAGGYALSRIGISSLPDVNIPMVSIQFFWPGAATEIVEHDLTEPVEEVLSGVEGVKSISSSSRLGSARISLEFYSGRSIDAAIQQIQTKIGQVRTQLPKDVEPEVIEKLNFDEFPIMWLSLSGPFSRQALADAARYVVKERLQRVAGVGDIQWGGYLDRNVRIWLRGEALQARNLSATEVLARLQREHLELPAGLIEGPGREMDVRILGEALTLDTLRSLPVGGTAGLPIRLSDVALVEDGFADERAFGRNNGQPGQALGVRKQPGANTVAVARGVRAAVAELAAVLPSGMKLDVNYDDSQFIQKSIADVEMELVFAVLFTGLVCLLFLGSWRAMANVLLAVPMSIIGTIAVVYWLGWTLNTFTLLALALVVGIVVDDAIMVQENISRHGQRGLDARRAASLGTREIAFAALAATVAVVAVFLPLGLVPSFIGQWFMQFGVTLSVAVALSYLEAITLAPARCAQFGVSVTRSAFGRASDAMQAAWERAYVQTLGWTVRHSWLVLGFALIAFVVGIVMVSFCRTELLPREDRSTLFVQFETPAGASLAETDSQVKRIESWLMARPEVSRVFTVVGGMGGTGANKGIIFTSLVPPGQRPHMRDVQLEQEARKALSTIPDLSVTFQPPGQPTGRGEVEFSLRGADWDTLAKAAETTKRRLAEEGWMVDIDSDFQLGRPELTITPDRDRIRDAGIAAGDVATAINALVGGIKIGKFSQDGRRVDVRAQLVRAERLRPEDVAAIRIRSGDGNLVPLSQLVTMKERPVLQAITRRDRSRGITIYGNLAPRPEKGFFGTKNTNDLRATMTFISGTLARDLPPGVWVVTEGQSQIFKEILLGFAVAFVLGLLLAWMILAAQFNSAFHSVTVLSVLPLAITGAAGGLLVFGFSLNVFSALGILLLMGIVKKNSILLVDFARRYQDGEDLGHDTVAPAAAPAAPATEPAARDAASSMIAAGQVRLRPILMTSAATMAAAVPVAIGLGSGAELRQPMAVAILGGVLVSTLLSLIVVPAYYVVCARHRWFAWTILVLAVGGVTGLFVWLLLATAK